MGSRTLSAANGFRDVLWSLRDQNSPCPYEEDIQITNVHGEEITLIHMITSNQHIYVCDKTVPKLDCESEPQETAETSNCSENGEDREAERDTSLLKTDPGPQPLSVDQARRLVSFYILAQNPGLASVSEAPGPLWVRCDMCDPAGTAWLGGEMLCTGSKVTGAKLYSVTCKGATADKSVMTLDEVKQEHRKRHRPTSSLEQSTTPALSVTRNSRTSEHEFSSQFCVEMCLWSQMSLKGSARYNLFGSTVVENTVIESGSSVTVDFRWTDVGRVLETPPSSSTATLNIRVSSGDMRSPMFELFRELEFLLSLADGLRTGEIEWLEPTETTSAVDLTKAYLEELQNSAKVQEQHVKPAESPERPSEGDTNTFTSLLQRGDLDFIEQLWVRLRKSVTSYQDIGDSLKLVVNGLRCGDLKPWVKTQNTRVTAVCKDALWNFSSGGSVTCWFLWIRHCSAWNVPQCDIKQLHFTLTVTGGFRAQTF